MVKSVISSSGRYVARSGQNAGAGVLRMMTNIAMLPDTPTTADQPSRRSAFHTPHVAIGLVDAPARAASISSTCQLCNWSVPWSAPHPT